MLTKNFNFELLPSVSATDGALFGIGQDVSLDDGGFTPGSTDWATQDSESSQTGVTNFGRERLLGPTWAWSLHVNRTSTAEALATLRSFRAAWHALHIRDTPGLVIPLRYQLEGVRRRIYGRPRRFDAPPENRILGGYIPITCDFKCVDGFTYDDEMSSATMLIGGEFEEGSDVDSGGGFVFPVTFPQDTLVPTQRQTQLLVQGDAPTYPIVTFNGPVANPELVTDDWRLSLNLTLADGDQVVIDTRPWKTTAILNGTASVGGLLGRRTRMDKLALPLGRFEARFNGTSSGSATCTVQWASTWNSI
jgi:hypothetical protein